MKWIWFSEIILRQRTGHGVCIIQRKNCITLKRKYWIDRSDGACSTSFQAEKEMDILAKAIIEGKNIHDIEEIKFMLTG